MRSRKSGVRLTRHQTTILNSINVVNDELDKIVYEQNENKEDDTIDFQQFMDIMLTKIKEKISNNTMSPYYNMKRIKIYV